MFQAKFDEAKYLTLGVGAINVTFTLVAVSTNSFLLLLLYWLFLLVDVRHKL